MPPRSELPEAGKPGGATRSLALIPLIGLSLLALVQTGRGALTAMHARRAWADSAASAALQLAVSGVDEAVVRLRSNPDWRGIPDWDLGIGTLSVSVDPLSAGSAQRMVTAVGRVSQSGRSSSRTVTATLVPDPLPAVYSAGIAARSGLTLRAEGRDGRIPTLSAVHSNADLSLEGGTTRVAGRITACGKAHVAEGTGLRGRVETSVPPLPFPEVTPSFKWSSLRGGETTGDVSLEHGEKLTGRIRGSLLVAGPRGCRLGGVVWVSGDAEIRGPILGSGTLVVDGRVEIDAAFSYPFDPDTNVFVICTKTGSGAVRLRGNSCFRGVVYAPYGEIDLRGGAEYQGSLAADRISVRGWPRVTGYAPAPAGAPPIPTVYAVKEYRER